MTAALEAEDQISFEYRTLAEKIAAFPAKTLDGLRIRAVILADAEEKRYADTDELMYRSIVRDLVTMTSEGGGLTV